MSKYNYKSMGPQYKSVALFVLLLVLINNVNSFNYDNTTVYCSTKYFLHTSNKPTEIILKSFNINECKLLIKITEFLKMNELICYNNTNTELFTTNLFVFYCNDKFCYEQDKIYDYVINYMN